MVDKKDLESADLEALLDSATLFDRLPKNVIPRETIALIEVEAVQYEAFHAFMLINFFPSISSLSVFRC